MNRSTALALPLLAALAACQTVDEAPGSQLAAAALYKADGSPAGTARVLVNGGEVTLSVTGQGITPGPHGVHLHTVGKCDAPDFTTAGGHLNPGMKQHGMDNPMGQHLGDLPNLVAGADGAGSVSVLLPGTAEALAAQLFDADGTAVVIHGGPDDYKTDPAGNSGPRVACGVLTRG